MADPGTPKPAPDRFRLRAIEMKLTAELHAARQRLRNAYTDEEKTKSREEFNRLLESWKDFLTRQVIPPDLE